MTDPSRRLFVFEERTSGVAQGLPIGDRFAELASGVEPQAHCFVGVGPAALRALEAAHEATLQRICIILDEPRNIACEELSRMTSSEAIKRSDILILCRHTAAEASQACARLFKASLPHASLLFLYNTAETTDRRPDTYWAAVRDFLRWGRGFVIRR
jgi:hypothetical protein